MKNLNLVIGVSLGLLLAGCPGEDTVDDTAGDGPTDATSSTGTPTDPTTTGSTPDPTTGDPSGTTGDPTDDTTGDPTDDTTGDSSGSTGEAGPVFEMEVYPIIMANCSCHVGGAPGGLSMSSAVVAYGNLLSVPSANMANEQNRIEPGSPDDSFLWQKINNTLQMGEGGVMPAGGNPMLGAEDLATIEMWIMGGAM